MVQACAFASSDLDVKRIVPGQAKVIMDGREACLVEGRTEAEHTDRHLSGSAALIPVQERFRRIRELESWKGQSILVRQTNNLNFRRYYQ